MNRICVVGAGRWGQNHVKTLDQIGCLGGLVEVNEDSRKRFSELYSNMTVHGSLDEALEAGYDGFTVATPAVSHFEIASRILKSGKPVLVEKPLALSSVDARRLKAIADECGQLSLIHI